MQLTINFIREAFMKYNKKYFSNSLMAPDFKINKSFRKFGTCAARLYGTRRHYTITISNCFERTEDEYCNTIIHEMIHLYIFQNHIKDTSSHGQVFKNIAQRINKDGWNIQAKGECPKQFSADMQEKNKLFNVFLVHNMNDKNFAFVVAKNKINDYANFLKAHNYQYKYIVSNDINKFGKYPICRMKIRGYYMTDEEYNKLIK